MSEPAARNSSERLVAMANDIARYFASDPDREAGIDGIVQHLMRFWEPRMLKRIREYVRAGGQGLDSLAREAVARLPEPTGTAR